MVELILSGAIIVIVAAGLVVASVLVLLKRFSQSYKCFYCNSGKLYNTPQFKCIYCDNTNIFDRNNEIFFNYNDVILNNNRNFVQRNSKEVFGRFRLCEKCNKNQEIKVKLLSMNNNNEAYPLASSISSLDILCDSCEMELEKALEYSNRLVLLDECNRGRQRVLTEKFKSNRNSWISLNYGSSRGSGTKSTILNEVSNSINSSLQNNSSSNNLKLDLNFSLQDNDDDDTEDKSCGKSTAYPFLVNNLRRRFATSPKQLPTAFNASSPRYESAFASNNSFSSTSFFNADNKSNQVQFKPASLKLSNCNANTTDTGLEKLMNSFKLDNDTLKKDSQQDQYKTYGKTLTILCSLIVVLVVSAIAIYYFFPLTPMNNPTYDETDMNSTSGIEINVI